MLLQSRVWILTAALLVGAAALAGQTAGQPRVVHPGEPGRAPSDAVVLFDGSDLANWTARGDITKCAIEEGALACSTGSGHLISKQSFTDAQIHLEFAIPSMPEMKGQLKGNSGVYLHNRFEIQILDSHENPTYAVGANAALYGQAPPLVNASRPPEQWQSFDIIFRAPRCNKRGQLVEQGVFTLLHNGVLVHDHVRIEGSERSCEKGKEGPAEGTLLLQDHSGFKDAPMTKMKFRNVWLRPL